MALCQSCIASAGIATIGVSGNLEHHEICHPTPERRDIRDPRTVQTAGQTRHHQFCRRFSGPGPVRRRRHTPVHRRGVGRPPRTGIAIRRHRRLPAAARSAVGLHERQGHHGGARWSDSHHRQPAGAGPDRQDHDFARRQGDRRRPYFFGDDTVLPALRRRSDQRTYRRRRRTGGPAGTADRPAPAQAGLSDSHLWQPEWRHTDSGAAQTRAGNRGAHPDLDRGGRPLWRVVLWHAPAAQHAGPERRCSRQPRLAGPLRQFQQDPEPRPARGLADRPAGLAGHGHHVQAVQRRTHQQPDPGYRRALPDAQAHGRGIGGGAQDLCRTRPGDGRMPAPRAGRRD